MIRSTKALTIILSVMAIFASLRGAIEVNRYVSRNDSNLYRDLRASLNIPTAKASEMSRSLTIDGKHVRDASSDVILTVKPIDIKKADKKDPTCCAVALAARRELGIKAARIHISKAYLLHDDNIWRRYNTPQPLRQEIITFDRGGKFSPGDYALIKPTGSSKLGAASGGKKKTKTMKKKRRVMHMADNIRERGPAATKHPAE